MAEIVDAHFVEMHPPWPNFIKPASTKTCYAQKSIAQQKQVTSQNYKTLL